MSDNSNSDADELREEYDLSKLEGAVRGKYAQRYRESLEEGKLVVPGDETPSDAD